MTQVGIYGEIEPEPPEIPQAPTSGFRITKHDGEDKAF